MTRKIKLKRGPKTQLPALDVAEMGFTTDTKQTYIGSATGNVELAKQETVDGLTTQLADKSKYENQIDYVDLLQRNMQFNAIQFKKRDAVTKDFEVSLKYGTDRHVAYIFSRNNSVAIADDYIIQNEGYVGKSELFTKASYDALSGDVETGFPPRYYARAVGATITKTFIGTGIDFIFPADIRGGLWEFKINNADIVKVTTYSNLPLSYPNRKINLFKDLQYGSHTVVGKFLGDDPNNAPSTGVGTARGWLSYGDGDLSTFEIHNGRSVTTNERSILQPYSNKEFAWSLKKTGSSSVPEWFPTHGKKTAFNVESEKIYIDGKLVDLNTVINIEGAKSFKLVQHVQAKHPDFPSAPLIDLVTIHSINLSGVVEVTCKAKFLEDTDIANGYVGMFPLVSTFVKELKTSLKNTYPAVKTDGSRTDLTNESDKASNYLALTNTYKQYGAAIRFNDIKHTLRQGAIDKYTGTMWLEHRATGLQKLYPQIFRNSIMRKGETFEWSLSYTIAEIPNLYDTV